MACSTQGLKPENGESLNNRLYFFIKTESGGKTKCYKFVKTSDPDIILRKSRSTGNPRCIYFENIVDFRIMKMCD